MTHGNIFVVGDDDQSIYGWRGAKIENILSFDDIFRGAKVYKLERNYRSTKKILELANCIIAHNTERRPNPRPWPWPIGSPRNQRSFFEWPFGTRRCPKYPRR